MYKNLNSQQYDAVTYPIKPLMVMAGAGTGKTTILTKRITHLINKEHIPSWRILAITFTNKAASEMNERITNLVGKSLEWICTFHGICVRILIEEIYNLGRKNNFRIIDEEECNAILKTIYEEYGFDKKNLSFKNALYLIENIKNNEINIEDLNSYNVQKKLKINDEKILNYIQKIYPRYIKKFEDYNYLDFNDILNFTCKIFDEFPEVSKKWSDKFDYILVDEFQDTNDIQYRLIEHLGGQKFNVFAVGDEDQIIYTFRGANSEVINKFINHFEDYKIDVLKLEENYRSTNQILNVANSLIEKNKNRIKKKLFSSKPDHSKPIYHCSNSLEEEASFVANRIQLLLASGEEPKDIAILYRSNHLSRAYEQSLIFSDIKYNLYGGFKFFQRTEIKDILAYLQVVDNNDEISILRIINVPRRKISDVTIKYLLDYAYKQNYSIWNAIVDCDLIDELTSAQKNAVNQFKQLIEELRQQKPNNIEKFFDYLVDKIQYYKYIESQDNKKLDSVSKNLTELKNSIIRFKENSSSWSLSVYLNNIALMNSSDENKKNKNAVSLMTIHAAKGLEFKYVFLVSFNDGIFPSNHSLMSENAIIEERRLAYVAITRAKHELYICSNKSYNFTTKDNTIPSRFLSEINPDLLHKNTSIYKVKSDKNLDWFDTMNQPKINKEEHYNSGTTNTYKIGDIVVHTVFGKGTIIDINGDILEISFNRPHGVKNIVFNHKSIKRQII